MERTQLAILKTINTDKFFLPLEDLLGKIPNAIGDLKALAEEGYIRPYEKEQFDFQADFAEQLKPGPRLSQKGSDFLVRLQFLF